MDLQAILDAPSSSSEEESYLKYNSSKYRNDTAAARGGNNAEELNINATISNLSNVSSPNNNNNNNNSGAPINLPSLSSSTPTHPQTDGSDVVSDISDGMLLLNNEDINELKAAMRELRGEGLSGDGHGSNSTTTEKEEDDIVGQILKSSRQRGERGGAGSGGGGGSGNLELERILREADFMEDDDADDDNVSVEDRDESSGKYPRPASSSSLAHSVKSHKYSGKATLQNQELDILQSILNEDDDDDDNNTSGSDSSFRGYLKYNSIGNKVSNPYFTGESSTTRGNKNSPYADLSSLSLGGASDGGGGGGGLNTFKSYSQPTSIPLSHSMEVDAILNSVKDDDDSDEDVGSRRSYLKQGQQRYHRRLESTSTASHDNDDVGESDEDDRELGLNLNFSSGKKPQFHHRPQYSHDDSMFDDNMSNQYPLSRSGDDRDEGEQRFTGKEVYARDGKRAKSSFGEGPDSLKDSTTSFLHRHNGNSGVDQVDIDNHDGGRAVYDNIHNVTTSSLTDDQRNDRVSALCLKQAETIERRLMKPNPRSVVSPLTVKRRMKPKMALMTKSRMGRSTSSSFAAQTQQQPQAPRFGFSGGIIQVKSMSDLGSHVIKNNAQNPIQKKQRDKRQLTGLPTALAVNSKFIAVGTQRGIIWVFDLFEQLKTTLEGDEGGANELPNLQSVTSIDLSLHGDYLLAGYGSGSVILWDAIKGTVLKNMGDLHTSPITSVRLTSFPIAKSGGSGSDKKDIGAVSVDAGGLVNKIVFSKGILWSTYSAESECLLDGTAGQILAMDALPPLDSTQHLEGGMEYHPSAYKIVLIALSSDRSSFAVSVLPKVSVLHRWARPAVERIDPTVAELEDQSTEVSSHYASTYASSYATSYASTYLTNSTYHSETEDPKSHSLNTPFLPCLSWGWGLVSGGKNSVTPILARAWGCCLQFLCANFPPRDENDSGLDDGTIHWPAFGLHDEFDATSPVVALNWLGKRSLVYLTVNNEFTIIDTVIMTMQERLDFSGIKLVYAEFALSRPRRPGSNLCTTFMNSIRSNDNRLLVLCQEEIKQITVLGMRQQISSLEDGGQWLEALALALDHFESTILSQEDQIRDSSAMKHSDVMGQSDTALLTEDEIWMAELLMRYLLLAIDNAPEPEEFFSPTNKRLNLAQSHFEMLSGVCLEYCIVMRRLDLLFGPIFRCFYEARMINVFLDVMESYILSDRLRYVAPEALVLFVSHCKDMKDLSMVERCLLHMDCSLMDFDSILNLLKKNALYTGLFHVYSSGLNDYVSPLEVLFESIFDAADVADNLLGTRREEGVLGTRFEQYGYKAM